MSFLSPSLDCLFYLTFLWYFLVIGRYTTPDPFTVAFPTRVTFVTTPSVCETMNAPVIAASDVKANKSFDILTGLGIGITDSSGRSLPFKAWYNQYEHSWKSGFLSASIKEIEVLTASRTMKDSPGKSANWDKETQDSLEWDIVMWNVEILREYHKESKTPRCASLRVRQSERVRGTFLWCNSN
jgi:hypothetical protein